MKLELINNQSQLIENAKRLHSYRAGVNREFYENLIARGATFIVVQIKDDFIFAPSRFVGYIKNSIEKYEYVYNKDVGFDGRDTNQKISKLLGKDREDALLDEKYLRYCERNEITPNNKKREYWPIIIDNIDFVSIEDVFDTSRIKSIESFSDIITNIMMFSNGLDSIYTDQYRPMIFNKDEIIALKIDDSYYFAPAFYAAFKGYKSNNFTFFEATDDEAENIITKLLNQEFKANDYLDEHINIFIKNKVKKFNHRLQKKYCYIDMDATDYKGFLSNMENDSTEKERNVNTRVGQIKFRSSLISKWGECSVTGCKEIGLLRASHIKPWTVSNDYERLDVFNGLLLIPNLDLLFDKGFISFDERGRILISDKLDVKTMEIMNIQEDMCVSLTYEHQKYMDYHRDFIFKG